MLYISVPYSWGDGAVSSKGDKQLDFQLSDEQQDLRKTVRDFAAREILPNVMKWDEESHFPLRRGQASWPARTDGDCLPCRIRRRRHGLCGVCDRDRGALARGWLGGHHRGRAYVAVQQPYFCRRKRGAEAQVHPQAGERRVHRCVGTDGARLGVGCWRRALLCRTQAATSGC